MTHCARLLPAILLLLLESAIYCLNNSYIQSMRMMIPTNIATTSTVVKRVLFLRHGQAMHNPRAEAARHSGCSYEHFIQLMREDDMFDAPLTELGKKQAQSVALDNDMILKRLEKVDFVVASPLSRALQTADLAMNAVFAGTTTRRISLEHFREINGLLLNAKRSDKKDLHEKYGDHWDFSLLESETDETWTPTLEETCACAERGYQGLLWILAQPANSPLVVTHGGLLTYMLSEHPNIKLLDGRSKEQQQKRSVSSRFANAELREFELKLCISSADDTTSGRMESTSLNEERRPTITVIEVTDFLN